MVISKVPEKIKLVTQWDQKSCSLACVAMLCGAPQSLVVNVAERLGIRTPTTSLDFRRIMTAFGVMTTPQVAEELFDGFIYKVTVPSLNVARGLHSVIIDCRGDAFQVFDPQNGNEGKEFYCSKKPLPYSSPMLISDIGVFTK